MDRKNLLLLFGLIGFILLAIIGPALTIIYGGKMMSMSSSDPNYQQVSNLYWSGIYCMLSGFVILFIFDVIYNW
jgi:hypothetical protein